MLRRQQHSSSRQQPVEGSQGLATEQRMVGHWPACQCPHLSGPEGGSEVQHLWVGSQQHQGGGHCSRAQELQHLHPPP
jgi:hypothetical protein